MQGQGQEAAQYLKLENPEHQRRPLEVATFLPREWRERLRAEHASVLGPARGRS